MRRIPLYVIFYSKTAAASYLAMSFPFSFPLSLDALVLCYQLEMMMRATRLYCSAEITVISRILFLFRQQQKQSNKSGSPFFVAAFLISPCTGVTGSPPPPQTLSPHSYFFPAAAGKRKICIRLKNRERKYKCACVRVPCGMWKMRPISVTFSFFSPFFIVGEIAEAEMQLRRLTHSLLSPTVAKGRSLLRCPIRFKDQLLFSTTIDKSKGM